MDCKGNCGDNGGIRDITTEKKIGIAIITETKKKNKASEDIGNYVTI